MLSFLYGACGVRHHAMRQRPALCAVSRRVNIDTHRDGRIVASAKSEPAFFDEVRDVAHSVLAPRGLAIASMEWQNAHLSIYISTQEDLDELPEASAPSLDDCEYASSAIGELLDKEGILPSNSYTLEMSTPGTTDVLTKQREFDAFKGFEIAVTTKQEYKGKHAFHGALQERTNESLTISAKGRRISIPREFIEEVKLSTSGEQS